jgi:hypothetical protein
MQHEQHASALGVSGETYRAMQVELQALVRLVAEDPRAWGFDLLPRSAPRRDVEAEFRRRTRLTGTLGGSFLQGQDALLALVPNPPTMPDGTPLDAQLQHVARLEPDAARDLAQHVRSTIQATLGQPIDEHAIEHAVREAAWDHDLDAARTTPNVLRAVAQLL